MASTSVGRHVACLGAAAASRGSTIRPLAAASAATSSSHASTAPPSRARAHHRSGHCHAPAATATATPRRTFPGPRALESPDHQPETL